MTPSATPNGFVVVDSDVASFIFKRDPIRAIRYHRHLQGRRMVLPFSVVAELLFWAEKNHWERLIGCVLQS